MKTIKNTQKLTIEHLITPVKFYGIWVLVDGSIAVVRDVLSSSQTNPRAGRDRRRSHAAGPSQSVTILS